MVLVNSSILLLLFLWLASNATCYVNLSIVDRSIKRQSIEMKGNAELARFERLMLCDQHCTVACTSMIRFYT